MSLTSALYPTHSGAQFSPSQNGERRKFVAMAVIGSFAGSLPSRASVLGRGEWFTIGIAGDLSQPKLLEGQLIPVNSKVWSIEQVGDFFSYTRQDNLKVPEAFTFRWRAEGEAQMQERMIRVRSQLPQDVVEKLASNASPPYAIILNFRVRQSVPDIKWAFFRLDRGASGGGGAPIAEGVITAEPQK